jgi:D-serine dehydratase
MTGILSHSFQPSPLNKGLGKGPIADGSTSAAIGWNLLREDVSLPVAVLSDEVMRRNLTWMQHFATAAGVQLAPHGKTTMAPALFARQIAAGAWGITLATAQQCLVAYHHGIKRVLLANQVVGKRNLEIIADLVSDPAFSCCCLVDSVAAVDTLGRALSARGLSIDVLLELGVAAGRTGVRDASQLEQVVAAISRYPQAIRLAGVELYEGVLKEETEIRAFLRRAITVARDLASRGVIRRTPALLSGAGSAWYDVVAEEFAHADIGMPMEVVLRPGCYLTHDAGMYRLAQARIMDRSSPARAHGPGLEPALTVWAYVHSRPEAGLAIIGLGKRDAAFDAGLPMPTSVFRPGTVAPTAAPPNWHLTRMMDQHASLTVHEADDLRVGDMIAFDISHPCLTCDKWRNLLVVDAEYTVIEIIPTFF